MRDLTPPRPGFDHRLSSTQYPVSSIEYLVDDLSKTLPRRVLPSRGRSRARESKSTMAIPMTPDPGIDKSEMVPPRRHAGRALFSLN